MRARPSGQPRKRRRARCPGVAATREDGRGGTIAPAAARLSAARFRPFPGATGGMRGRRLLRHFRLFGMLAATLALATAEARAQARLPVPTPCRGEVFAGGKVAAVIDGRSFTLEDGREVRLAGLEVPFPPRPGETGPAADAGTAARKALAAMVAGQNVELRQTSATPDRYGRTLAFAFVDRDGTLTSIAHEMLGKGFARVAASIGDKAGDKSADLACAAELL